MRVGIQRLNARKSQPNDHIVFIKPLKGPDEAVAQDFLERIAAQCLPIMRENHLFVMTLEEYEPNLEFVGRNFNAGEVVQLVLKARSTGHWLPFDYVQMVFMHELAHCKQMNHSKAFWALRNQYAEQMRLLLSRGYRGEGIWGRGASLSSGEFEKKTMLPGEQFPEHLCGGMYQSSRRKRKVKQVLTYQEQKERRVVKKFGAKGVALGEDVMTKKQLEGRKVAAKPRVASSARGRELRAAAALARFDQPNNKASEPDVEVEVGTASKTETESGDEYEDGQGDVRAIAINGTRMIKVYENERLDDQDAKNELLQLQSSIVKAPRFPSKEPGIEPETQECFLGVIPTFTGSPRMDKTPQAPTISNHPQATPRKAARNTIPDKENALSTSSLKDEICTVCTFSNEPLSITCSVCANVLEPESVPESWHCRSEACRGSKYLTAGDCGVCGACGQRRPTA